jgi:hypothetical protein
MKSKFSGEASELSSLKKTDSSLDDKIKDNSKSQDHADEEIKDHFKEEQEHYSASIQKIEVQTKLEKA